MNTTPRKDSQAPTSFTSFALHNQVSMQEQPKIRPVTKHMGYFWKVVNLESYVVHLIHVSCVMMEVPMFSES